MTQSRYLLLVSVILIAACGAETTDDRGTDDTTGQLVVYTSNYPLYYFTQRVGGDLVRIHFPMASAEDPAYWQPVADTIVAMQSADLIILNGATYEQWLMNASLAGGNVLVTSSAFTNDLIPSGETFSHSHGAEGEHEHSGTASNTWLDLSLAVMQAEAIRDALISKQPANRATFESNFDSVRQDLLALDNGFRELAVDPNESWNVVYSHPVFQYLARAYRIQGESLHLESDQPITPEIADEVRGLMDDNPICCFVWEYPPVKSSVALIESLGLNNIVISPAANFPVEGDFLDVMGSNLNALKDIKAAQ